MSRVLVTGGTKDDVAPIAVFIMNIKETNADLFDEIVVFHDGISAKDQKIINDIFPTRFIIYKPKLKSMNDEILTYFSYMVYCKYECFSLLKDYTQVVWSDYDVVVQGRLDEFCQINDNEFNLLTCADNIRSMFYKDIKNKEILNYNLELEGVGTPLFALSEKVGDAEAIYTWCYKKTEEWDVDLYLPEQCIFGLAVQEFDIPLKRFDFSKYACYPTKVKGGEIIIHAAGQPKFWNGMNNDTWNRLYSEWCRLGGSKYSELRKKMKRKRLLVLSRLKGVRSKEHF